MTRVKICGIASVEDASAAVNAGADAIGFVFADSPRRVSVDRAVEIAGALRSAVALVGVFVDAEVSLVCEIVQAVGLDGVQVHGEETPEYCERLRSCAALCREAHAVLGLGHSGRAAVIKRLNVRSGGSPDGLREQMARYEVDAVLLDPGAGSGRTFDWRIAAPSEPRAQASGLPLILSGGLTPNNVAEAIRIVRPHAVDVSSGVEVEPGVKDVEKLGAFVAAVRKANAD